MDLPDPEALGTMGFLVKADGGQRIDPPGVEDLQRLVNQVAVPPITYLPTDEK
jgi:hypothetical protein